MSADRRFESDRLTAGSAVKASPLGVTAMLGGVVLAVVFFVWFQDIIEGVDNDDLSAAIQALEITVIAVWVAVALWGWYLVKDGFERANTNRRLSEQAQMLAVIQEVLQERDHAREQQEALTKKSRSFWDWRRSDD